MYESTAGLEGVASVAFDCSLGRNPCAAMALAATLVHPPSTGTHSNGARAGGSLTAGMHNEKRSTSSSTIRQTVSSGPSNKLSGRLSEVEPAFDLQACLEVRRAFIITGMKS